MKNDKIIEAWSKIKADRTDHDRILNNILAKVHTDASRKRIHIWRMYWKILVPVAACVIITLVIAVPSFLKSDSPNEWNDIIESRSGNDLYVCDVDDLPELMSRGIMALVEKTEDELFNEIDTDIFSGTIVNVRNIEVNYKGYIQYKAFAEISVDEVYRGSCNVGDVLSILLEDAIRTNVLTEDNGVASYMNAGVKGIFMPYRYDESSTIFFGDDAELPYLELAEYGFPDIEQYAFLETRDGLIFDRGAYKSVSGAQTLDEIKQFVNTMLRQ